MRLKVLLRSQGFGLWGAGKGGFRADVETYKVRTTEGVEVVAIPGAYVKGLLRGWAYRLAPLLREKGLISGPVRHDCFVGDTCGSCIVCRVFGASGGRLAPLSATTFYPVKPDRVAEASRLSPDDLLSKPDLLYLPRTSYLPHVKIEDSSAKAATGGLFHDEVVPPNVQFYGEVALNEALLEEVEAKDACLVVLLALSQLRLSYAGRRSMVDVALLEGSDVGAASSSELCMVVVRRLMSRWAP